MKKEIILMTCILTLGFGTTLLAREKLVTLSVEKAGLLDVLEEIKEQSGFGYLISNKYKTVLIPVTVNLKNVELNFALKQIMKNQPLDYSIASDCIVIHDRSFNFGLFISLAIISLSGLICIIYFSRRDGLEKKLLILL